MIKLSKSEKIVLDLLCQGLSNNEMADKVFVHNRTIKFHLTNIYKKLGVKSRAAAIVAYQNVLASQSKEPAE